MLSSTNSLFGDTFLAVESFDEIDADVHLLVRQDKGMFPTSQMVVLEYVDGWVYTCSDYSATSSDSAVVEMWRDNPFINSYCKFGNQFPREHLSLRGDVVCICYCSDDGRARESTLHTSLIELNATDVTATDDMESVAAILRYKRQLSRLIALRDHICAQSSIVSHALLSGGSGKEWSIAWQSEPRHFPRYAKSLNPVGVAESLVLNTCRFHDGGCMNFLSSGAVRGIFPSSRTVLELGPNADVGLPTP